MCTTAAATHPDHPLPLGPASSFGIKRRLGTVVVSVGGEIDLEAWLLVDRVLRDLIDAQGNLDVVLDLWDVDALEHAAIPLILRAARQAHSHGGKLRLADRACRDRRVVDSYPWPPVPPASPRPATPSTSWSSTAGS